MGVGSAVKSGWTKLRGWLSGHRKVIGSIFGAAVGAAGIVSAVVASIDHYDKTKTPTTPAAATTTSLVAPTTPAAATTTSSFAPPLNVVNSPTPSSMPVLPQPILYRDKEGNLYVKIGDKFYKCDEISATYSGVNNQLGLDPGVQTRLTTAAMDFGDIKSDSPSVFPLPADAQIALGAPSPQQVLITHSALVNSGIFNTPSSVPGLSTFETLPPPALNPGHGSR